MQKSAPRHRDGGVERDYTTRTKKSYRMYLDASKIMPGGQSHNSRFFSPYPFYANKARGKYIWDVDGNRYTDYWMGHTALIFGHSPSFVVKALKKQVSNGLLYGAPNRHAYELARLVSETVPSAESVRFCTTGAEATMYAVRLARGYTKRKTIVKITGGWHGYNSSLTIGVSAPYDIPESSGLVSDYDRFVRLASFNNVEQTRQIMAENPEDIAAVIIEPVMGAGGVLPAEKEYLGFLRGECSRIGALLIFDEIITGFRLSLGGAQEYYGVIPDITTLGKILGGGLPVSAIVGKSEILELANANTHGAKTERVWIGGGTFSENALCMCAGIATVSNLIETRRETYKRLGKFGERLRNSVDKAFSEHGYRTSTTGAGSLFATHFLTESQKKISSPEDVNVSDRATEKEYYLSLIAKHGIYFIPGHIGAVSTVHSASDIDKLISASLDFAKRKDAK
ncbi:MAG: aspartate aminotransferase family protein [Nitrososphaerales archaeon]